MIKKKSIDIIEVFLYFFLLLFGIFIGYQIGRIILGGSWVAEDVIIALLVFTLGITLMILRRSDGNFHKIEYLQKSFNSLARDYKQHMDGFHYTKSKK
ncbi:MAG: hypothetical protein KKF44_04580 [Nanoarchaeota archaeon]|nr:hypothetical protein [Nanoarchaeota archaeon]